VFQRSTIIRATLTWLMAAFAAVDPILSYRPQAYYVLLDE
jgi:hypothetical protein